MGTPHSIYIFMDNPSAGDGLSVNSNHSLQKSIKCSLILDYGHEDDYNVPCDAECHTIKNGRRFIA
jgi:hypothetical protein